MRFRIVKIASFSPNSAIVFLFMTWPILLIAMKQAASTIFIKSFRQANGSMPVTSPIEIPVENDLPSQTKRDSEIILRSESGNPHRIFGIAVFQNDAESVATQTRKQIVVAQSLSQQGAQLSDQLVASNVATVVINDFQLIEMRRVLEF